MRITIHELRGFGAESASLAGASMAHLTDRAFPDTRITLSEPLIPALSEIFTPPIHSTISSADMDFFFLRKQYFVWEGTYLNILRFVSPSNCTDS
jgi:hypothetical protein